MENPAEHNWQEAIRLAYNRGITDAAKLCEQAIRLELNNFNDIERGWNEALTAAAGSIRKQVKED